MLANLLVLALAGAPSVPPAPAPAPATVDGLGQRLLRRSLGLGVTAGVFGAAWIGMKLTATVADADTARAIESGRTNPDECVEGCYTGGLFNPLAAPLLVGSAAFLGAGMHAHGRRLAFEQRGIGRTRRNGVVLAAVGGGVLGTGAVVLALGLAGQWFAHTPTAGVTSREVGWWGGAALGLTGAALLGLGHGVVRGHDERRRRVDVAVAPMLGSGFAGLSVGGRF